MKRFIMILLFTIVAIFTNSQLAANQNIVVLLGPPGAGKGTMCKKLTQASSLPHISTGDLLRLKSKQSDKQAQKLKEYISSGQLVPDEFILDLLKQRVMQDDCKNGFILDGFPRTKSQAEALAAQFSNPERIVFVNVSLEDNTILERLQGRRVCSACSKPYHITFNPPKVADQCNDCGAKLTCRSDDTYDVITKRLKIYQAQYAPIKAFLKERYQWIDVKNESADDCFTSIVDKINTIDTEFIAID